MLAELLDASISIPSKVLGSTAHMYTTLAFIGQLSVSIGNSPGFMEPVAMLLAACRHKGGSIGMQMGV